MTRKWTLTAAAMILTGVALIVNAATGDIVRPEEIKSKRQVVYDDATYAKLETLWQEYYDAYPSEYAYANWMYAARYAGDKDYPTMLDRGLDQYPANPTLLYLKALTLHGKDNARCRKLYERATSLDPSYADPWFGLVDVYMVAGDEERTNLALRHLLESGIITDEVLDYNYNMLVSLEPDAILITNGDNDTYPGWILTRILGIRPDVSIVNRSLLNTDWYPLYVIDQGVPRFIGQESLEKLRAAILKDMKDNKTGVPLGGPFGDTLILRLVESAQRAGRPVYFSKTLYTTDMLRGPMERGRDLGLVTLVTASETSYARQMQVVYEKWTESFRTAGLDSWRLRNAPESDAGRQLVPNYAAGIAGNLEAIKAHVPELRIALFDWYIDHVEPMMKGGYGEHVAQAWCCYANDLPKIDAWCKTQGVKCEKPKPEQ
jgi:hypothetical protein